MVSLHGTCPCGRPRHSTMDFARWRHEVPFDSFYGGAPCTWQLVRLGVCLPPNDQHLDPVYPLWALDVCWKMGWQYGLRCMLADRHATRRNVALLDRQSIGDAHRADPYEGRTPWPNPSETDDP